MESIITDEVSTGLAIIGGEVTGVWPLFTPLSYLIECLWEKRWGLEMLPVIDPYQCVDCGPCKPL